MKATERKKARELRKKGFSIREIAQHLPSSKSSISRWVYDIVLTDKQIERLKTNQDKGRARAAQHPNSPKMKWGRIRNEIIEKSSVEMPDRLSKTELKILGAALYWAEGYNASRNYFLFSNSNPDMIRVMMFFLKECCNVPINKIKGRVNIHPHQDIKKAEKFWSNIAGIDRQNFNKPLLAVSKASKHKKDNLPMGTFNICICDVYLLSTIKGWIKGLTKGAVSSVGRASGLHSEGSQVRALYRPPFCFARQQSN